MDGVQSNLKYKNDLVIGRLQDTNAGEQLGMERLNSDRWTVNVNDAWVQGGIDGRKTFYMGSLPTIGNLRSGNAQYPTTVFYRELRQLRDAGYVRSGEYLIPGR